ncbi:uncharacterized protein BT62DRAFT_1074191 [Guyanagaster necrorhizus]|uniref:Uncharacterized protein n=1 Tax=Guyanagaster necrorhizus TaxID=856835 RepID=A0A9P7VY69_9AGAR|nr:uncharacterized protein BT62DRAFT_1074191 [Guyanagaster necrorhizus MCA 3950]KAG7448635.1 hypothetical protein BT62DRAFT_1074191 [Guyanagaster necrorhizus MCA 3950]
MVDVMFSFRTSASSTFPICKLLALSAQPLEPNLSFAIYQLETVTCRESIKVTDTARDYVQYRSLCRGIPHVRVVLIVTANVGEKFAYELFRAFATNFGNAVALSNSYSKRDRRRDDSTIARHFQWPTLNFVQPTRGTSIQVADGGRIASDDDVHMSDRTDSTALGNFPRLPANIELRRAEASLPSTRTSLYNHRHLQNYSET